LTIAQMLTAVRKLICHNDYNGLRICIISGQMGGRAVTFKCTEHILHLSDMFFTFEDKPHAEHMIQMVNRISGIYTDKPTLRLWTTSDNFHTIRKCHDAVEELAEAMESGDAEEDPIERLQALELQVVSKSIETL